MVQLPHSEADAAGCGGEKQWMVFFGRIDTAPVLQKELGGTCATKGSTLLIGEKSEFLTYVFINDSVDLMQKEALAF